MRPTIIRLALWGSESSLDRRLFPGDTYNEAVNTACAWCLANGVFPSDIRVVGEHRPYEERESESFDMRRFLAKAYSLDRLETR